MGSGPTRIGAVWGHGAPSPGRPLRRRDAVDEASRRRGDTHSHTLQVACICPCTYNVSPLTLPRCTLGQHPSNLPNRKYGGGQPQSLGQQPSNLPNRNCDGALARVWAKTLPSFQNDTSAAVPSPRLCFKRNSPSTPRTGRGRCPRRRHSQGRKAWIVTRPCLRCKKAGLGGFVTNCINYL